MNVNLDAPIIELDGSRSAIAMHDPTDIAYINQYGRYKVGSIQLQTVGTLAVQALNVGEEKQIPHETSVRRGLLIAKINKGGQAELTLDEIVEIKRLAAVARFTPIWLTQLSELLEDKSNPFSIPAS